MNNKIILFVVVSFLSGLFAFIGSVLGNAFGQSTLFIGAIFGGCTGIVLSARLLAKHKILRKDSSIPMVLWGIASFGVATLFAITNLSNPFVPLLSISLIGLGSLLGSAIMLHEQKKQLLFSIVGYLLITPTLYFVIGSLVKYNIGLSQSFTLLNWMENQSPSSHTFKALSPLLFLGGPLIAMVLNFYTPFQKVLPNSGWDIKSMTITIANRAIASTAAVLFVTLSGYLFLENLM